VRKSALQGVFGQLGNGLQRRQGNFGANDRGYLEQALVLKGRGGRAYSV
jgi:hypothetical protein